MQRCMRTHTVQCSAMQSGVTHLIIIIIIIIFVTMHWQGKLYNSINLGEGKEEKEWDWCSFGEIVVFCKRKEFCLEKIEPLD